ncbi:MAG: glycosyltransferase [Lachnospiraceae bacterium]|nr:glycosyltransferase [Lachnospiraceae bacterium]
MKILVVIPARGGSKRIPRKNIRMIGGKPLILYSVENAKNLKNYYDTDIVVSTDDEELESIVSKQDSVFVIQRDQKLATDKVTLDPVIYDAVIKMEEKSGKVYDIVITMQATSPTLKPKTLIDAVRFFVESHFDTVISVVNKPHLSWTEKDGVIVKNYEKRLNSQELPKNYLETGAFLITRRKCVTENARIGEKVSVFETLHQEAVDIDTEEDWIQSESILNRKRILFRTVGYQKIGMGHIYRCLTLAYKLIGHDLLFVVDKDSDMGIQKLQESFFPMKVVADELEYEELLKEYKPDIVINDILNTDEKYMQSVRKYTDRIVNFEDVGAGAKYADAVINALYENNTKKLSNVYEGFKYFCIRDEFMEEPPKKFSEEVKNIMIIFGGADPSNLTGKMYDVCKLLHEKYKDLEFHFLTGFAYEHKEEIVSDESKNIFVHHDVKRVSSYMCKADLAITSQGRTIYELASMGVPAIVMAQNEREAEHVFAGIQNGFVNLGLGSDTDAITVIETIRWLISTPNVRKEMRKLQLSKEFRKGQQRVINLILNESEQG